MLTRKQTPVYDPSLPREVNDARKSLAAKGWSYRAAAPLLGVHHVHLALVLKGRRESKRLLGAIRDLPSREVPA
jgi:hypothetical protein